jgi:superfamily I DNA and/or RNA helicase
VRDFVVLSFYDAQTALLVRFLQPLGVRTCNVDSFQGQEANIVCIALVVNRQPSAFITDVRRINVACSRTQHQLVLFGRRALFHHPSAALA